MKGSKKTVNILYSSYNQNKINMKLPKKAAYQLQFFHLLRLNHREEKI